MTQGVIPWTLPGCLLLFSSLVRLLPSPVAQEVRLPTGSIRELDGVLEKEEWRPALSLPLSDGGDLLLMKEGDLVSIGIRGPGAGFPHLAVAKGDTIRILHASAALGSVVYVRDGEEWQKVQDPAWEVRSPSLAREGEEERERYLSAHGWVGTTGRMGPPEEAEFLLSGDRFRDEGIRLAVGFFLLESPDTHPHWPEELQDDVLKTELFTGPMPDRLRFSPESWGIIRKR